MWYWVIIVGFFLTDRYGTRRLFRVSYLPKVVGWKVLEGGWWKWIVLYRGCDFYVALESFHDRRRDALTYNRNTNRVWPILVGLLREREGGKWTKCLVLSKIVQQHRLSSLYPRRRLCIEYRWTLSRRGNISKVGGESFEKIISINCHFTTASFKRVDRSLEISEPRYRYRLILFTIVDRSSDSILRSILPIHEYKEQEYCNERKEESRDDKMTITEYRSARSLSTFLVE